MVIILSKIGLVFLIVGISIIITKLTKKFCEDDFDPDNW